MDSNNTHFGRLLVSVTTALGAIPLEDAEVHIYGLTAEDGTRETLYTLRTDSSGRTPKILLPTVAESLSEVPGNPYPYIAYTASVRKDGYYNVERTNIPIFEGITSIQPIDLIPLAEYGTPDSATPEFPPRVQNTPDNGNL